LSTRPLTVFSISGNIVDVKVGSEPDSKIFHVHKEVLAAAPFFQNALKPKWEARRNAAHIVLSDETPRIFDLYLQYLYVRIIPEALNWADLAHLYVLGEKLMHNEFQNAIVGRFIARLPRAASSTAVNIIYDGTPEGLLARKLMVDMICFVGGANWVRDTALQTFRPEFVNGAFVALLEYRSLPQQRPWVTNPGVYFAANTQGNEHN
jgi:hypothetical protein